MKAHALLVFIAIAKTVIHVCQLQIDTCTALHDGHLKLGFLKKEIQCCFI